ncbi:S41 family peptidase [Pelagicoccus sp. SDUM812002]|uniref:S41 family peptidase n=1 Tax=Pelagicoccus sp. SDUM812002 TaxID=3041266 RepID=UPI00280F10D9|nr:S41 family peptidase [Pelagicoccus sp. SDUM812002]MDQ8186305.1 S41 family peptidase [Pelagicoccus sp. SDUM812002]
MRKFTQILGLFFSSLPVVSWAWADQTDFAALREETFEAAWSQVGASYYDSTFGGLDWDEVGDRYRAKLPTAESMDQVRALISSMIYELGDSHLALISSDYDPEEIMKPWSGGAAGVEACYAGDRIVFYRVDPKGAAYEAGLRNGDILLAVDGERVKDFRRSLEKTGQPEHVLKYSLITALLSRLRTEAGEKVKLLVRSPRGKKRLLTVELKRYEGRSTEPLGRMGRMPLGLEATLREDGVAYLRFNLWFPAVMPEVRAFVGSLPAETSGLVIDLRGNPGGMMVMAGGLAGLVLQEQAELGRTTLRSGHVNVVGFPQKDAFAGKAAILVDETSVSTSEVFAIGLQELGRARVFGQPTPGAALPSVFFALPNGDSLQIALGDFKTPNGVSLEARGVIPDEVVSVSPVELSAGKDTVLSAALNWIHQPN